jgi:hypothetical protein
VYGVVITLFLFGFFMLMQADSNTFIEPDTPITIRLNGGETILTYESGGDDIISVTARAVDEIDTVLEILTPDLHRLAYNDDHNTTTTDSAIEHFLLKDAGIYTVRVNSFNGVSEGEVEVTLVQVAPLKAELVEDQNGMTITVKLTPRSRYYYIFDVNARDLITVTARDPHSVLDPMLTLRNASGAEVSRSDDHTTRDLTLNIFDARMETLTLGQGGEYTIELREFMGRGGVIELRLEFHERN